MNIANTYNQSRKYKIFKRLFILTVIVPNILELLLMNRFPLPGGFGFLILVILSLYYIPVASIFGRSIFVTETVIAPHGVKGILLSVIFYSVPYLLWWIFIIRPHNK